MGPLPTAPMPYLWTNGPKVHSRGWHHPPRQAGGSGGWDRTGNLGVPYGPMGMADALANDPTVPFPMARWGGPRRPDSSRQWHPRASRARGLKRPDRPFR